MKRSSFVRCGDESACVIVCKKGSVLDVIFDGRTMYDLGIFGSIASQATDSLLVKHGPSVGLSVAKVTVYGLIPNPALSVLDAF